MQFLKPELLILVPFLIGIGELLKKKVKANSIPLCLILVSIFVSMIYGLFVSDYTGWRYFVDVFFNIGLLHGSVAAFCAMGLYDTAKLGVKK